MNFKVLSSKKGHQPNFQTHPLSIKLNMNSNLWRMNNMMKMIKFRKGNDHTTNLWMELLIIASWKFLQPINAGNQLPLHRPRKIVLKWAYPSLIYLSYLYLPNIYCLCWIPFLHWENMISLHTLSMTYYLIVSTYSMTSKS